MALQCNIDTTGARLRLWGGVVVCLAAIAIVVAGWTSSVAADYEALAKWGGLVLFAGGGFMIFEGLNRWCVAKAFMARFLGFKNE